MASFDPLETVSFREIALTPRDHSISFRVSDETLKRFASDITLERVYDDQVRASVYRLRKRVLEHIVLDEVTAVPYTTVAEVQLPEPRWHPAPGACGAIGLTFAGVAAGNLLLVLTAMAVALVTVIVCCRRQPTVTRRVRVVGQVQVRTRHANAFPDADFYPDHLGAPIRVAVMEQAR